MIELPGTRDSGINCKYKLYFSKTQISHTPRFTFFLHLYPIVGSSQVLEFKHHHFTI